MTPQEFKAWFDGYTEALDAAPTEKQWKRIKAQVAKIDNVPLNIHTIYRDYPRWSCNGWPYYVSNTMAASGAHQTVGQSAVMLAAHNSGLGAQAADTRALMYHAGKCEAEEAA